MNRPAALIVAIAFNLTGACAMAQTTANPNAANANAKPKAKPAAVSKAVKTEAAVVALAPPTAKTVAPNPPEAVAYPISAYMRGQSLEASNRRLALAAYRQAAAQGHGPSQKRLWELLKDTPGSESVATVYQKEAWNQRVPGVPEPLSPVRFN